VPCCPAARNDTTTFCSSPSLDTPICLTAEQRPLRELSKLPRNVESQSLGPKFASSGCHRKWGEATSYGLSQPVTPSRTFTKKTPFLNINHVEETRDRLPIEGAHLHQVHHTDPSASIHASRGTVETAFPPIFPTFLYHAHERDKVPLKRQEVGLSRTPI
jgi:hypothetical protein